MTSLLSLRRARQTGARLRLHSEAYTRDGGAGADAIRRVLGRPRLDGLSMLLREAVQNAWDARVPGGGTSGAHVAFTARLGRFSEAELAALSGKVFADRPEDRTHPLSAVLAPEMGRLILEDRGTVGLDGPVFMGQHRSAESPGNFLRFFRMVGRTGASNRGGGSYGFGKSVFFNASRGATAIVHSRFQKPGGGVGERLMAMSLWKPGGNHHLTGRHWWGVPDAQHAPSVKPLTGPKAAALAQELGFASFAEGETGTSIMILAPQFGAPLDGDWELAARCIAETMVLWHWPRMLGNADQMGRIGFRVFLEGEAIPVPDPERTPPFNLYAQALQHIAARRRGSAAPDPSRGAREIVSERPKARLGWLAFSLGARPRQRVWQSVQAIEGHPLADQLNGGHGGSEPSVRHIALLRSPGQVIRYLPAGPWPDARRDYAGIFLLDADPVEFEDDFVDAEPPSHDDWVPDERSRNARNVVRIALRRIREAAEAFADGGKPSAGQQVQNPLSALSAELGPLISGMIAGPARTGGPPERADGARGSDGARGTGSGNFGTPAQSGDIDAGGTPANGASRRAAVRMIGGGQLVQGGEGRELQLRFSIDGHVPHAAVLRAFPRVIVAGGQTEKDAPAGAAVARVLGWRDPAGKERPPSDTVRIGSCSGGEWLLRVSVPPDAKVGVALSIVAHAAAAAS